MFHSIRTACPVIQTVFAWMWVCLPTAIVVACAGCMSCCPQRFVTPAVGIYPSALPALMACSRTILLATWQNAGLHAFNILMNDDFMNIPPPPPPPYIYTHIIYTCAHSHTYLVHRLPDVIFRSYCESKIYKIIPKCQYFALPAGIFKIGLSNSV